MIRVIVRITVAEGKRQEYLDSLRPFFAETLAKAGCLEYEPATDVTVPFEEALPAEDNVVTFIEKWECIGAFHNHARSKHALKSRMIGGHLVQRIEVQLLEVK